MKLQPGHLTGTHCPWCSDGEQVIRQNKHTEEFFLSCTKWPECKFSANLPEHIRLKALGAKGLFDD